MARFYLTITGGTVVKVKHSCSNFHLEWKMTQAARLSIYGKLEVIEESRMWALLTSDNNNNSLLIIILIIIQMIIFIIIIICIFIIVIIKFSNFPQWKRRERKNRRLTVMVCFTEGPISKAFLTSETLSLYTTWSGLENLKGKKEMLVFYLHLGDDRWSNVLHFMKFPWSTVKPQLFKLGHRGDFQVVFIGNAAVDL